MSRLLQSLFKRSSAAALAAAVDPAGVGVAADVEETARRLAAYANPAAAGARAAAAADDDDAADAADQSDEAADASEDEDQAAEGTDGDESGDQAGDAADDEDEDEDESGDHASAAVAERARVAAILDCDEAKGRETLARHLAFNTDASPDDARATLAAAPVGQRGNLAERMNKVKKPALGPGGADASAEDNPETVADRLAAYVKPPAR